MCPPGYLMRPRYPRFNPKMAATALPADEAWNTPTPPSPSGRVAPARRGVHVSRRSAKSLVALVIAGPIVRARRIREVVVVCQDWPSRQRRSVGGARSPSHSLYLGVYSAVSTWGGNTVCM